MFAGRRLGSGDASSEQTHAFEKCRTVFHCGARPWLLLLAVHATLEPYKETVSFVQVRPELLNLVVARPRLVHLLTSFVQSAHLQPQFMIDGSMGEQMASEIDEHLFMTCGSEGAPTSSKHDVCTLVEKSRRRHRSENSLMPESTLLLSCVHHASGSTGLCKRSLKQFSTDVEVVDAFQLVKVVRVPSETMKDVFQHRLQAIVHPRSSLKFCEKTPVTFIGKVVKYGLSSVLLCPIHVFLARCRVGSWQGSQTCGPLSDIDCLNSCEGAAGGLGFRSSFPPHCTDMKPDLSTPKSMVAS